MQSRDTKKSNRRDRGVVLPLAALMMTVVILMVSFAVDLGRLRAERRDLQADADAIALDAVQQINGKTHADALAAAIAEANASADRNDFDYIDVLTADNVQVGFWNVKDQEFCVGRWRPGATLGTQVCTDHPEDYPDAVKVTLTSSIPMHFDLSADERSVNREAVAVSVAKTRGRLGSVVAGVNPPEPLPGCAIGASGSVQYTITNHIYTKLLGITVRVDAVLSGEEEFDENVDCEVFGPGNGISLDAVSYEGLADADINMDDLAAALGFGSADALLAGNVTQKDVLTAAATVLQSDDSTADAGADLGAIAAAMASDVDATFAYEDMVGATTGSGTSAAGSTVNALDLLLLTATAIDGNNFVGADGTFTFPAYLPSGLADIATRVHVIESPQNDPRWRYQGQSGPLTSQVTIALDVPLAFNGDVVDLSHLSFLGVGANASVTGTGSLPIVIEVGHADSWYPRIACMPQGQDNESIIEMLVNSGAARVSIGAIADGAFDENYSVTSPTQVVIDGNASVNLDLGLLSVGLGLSLTSITDLSDDPIIEDTFGSGSSLGVDSNYELNAGGGSESHQFEFADPGPTDYWRYRGGLTNLSVTDTLLATHNFGASYSGTLGLLTAAQSKVVANEVIQKALDPYLASIDTTVLQPLLNAVGATVGGADGRINEVQCQGAALANRG